MKNNQHLPGTLAAITLATLTGTAAAQDPFGADPTPAAPVEVKRPAAEKEAYIGVHMSRPNEIVATQLGLEDGVGIVVEAVQKESPAEEAGLKRYDILTKLEDQLLVQPEQFATLVRRYEPGDKVTLTVLRHAKEQKVKITLGSRDKARMSAFPRNNPFGGQFGGDSVGNLPGGIIDISPFRGGGSAGGDAAGGDEIDLSQSLEAIRKALGSEYSDEIARQVQKALRQSLDVFEDLDLDVEMEDDGAEVKVEEEKDEEGNTVSKVRSVTKSSFSTVVRTEDGYTVNLTGKNGDRRIIIADDSNSTVYEGPYNNDKDKKKIPENLRDKVKVLDNIKVDVRRR